MIDRERSADNIDLIKFGPKRRRRQTQFVREFGRLVEMNRDVG